VGGGGGKSSRRGGKRLCRAEGGGVFCGLGKVQQNADEGRRTCRKKIKLRSKAPWVAEGRDRGLLLIFHGIEWSNAGKREKTVLADSMGGRLFGRNQCL